MPRPDHTRGETLDTRGEPWFRRSGSSLRPVLVVAWCQDEPWRVGEVIGDPADGGPAVFGRGEPGAGRVGSVQQRPGENVPALPWLSPRLSRDQLAITREDRAIELVSLGRRELLLRGVAVATARLAPGDVVEVRNQLVLTVALRPPRLPFAPSLPVHRFGEPDGHGLVGESPAMWELRRRVQFVGRRAGHALVLGPSGSGKELVAAAIHAIRGRGPLVSRNAATLPEGLVDAELFGNVRNYPNPGMAERAGLVGAADGGTLFLDELGELPATAQAHLLRVLDDGEYQRLGDPRVLRSQLRLVAATNRPVEALKEDVAARFPFVVPVPGLDARREDVPLIARHLLTRIAREDAELAARFFADGVPRLSPALVTALVTVPYPTNVRQLSAILWRSLSESPGDTLDAPSGLLAAAPSADPVAAWCGRPAASIPPEVLQAALDAANGQVEAAAQALGLPSRFVLSRQIRKYGLVRRTKGG